MRLLIQLEGACRREIGKVWLRGVVRHILEMEGVPPKVELGVVVTGDDTVARLNQRYRGVEATTDVLAFSLTEGEEPFIGPPDGTERLGEVIISYPQAQRQALRVKHRSPQGGLEVGHPVRREVAHLVVHGVLHLLGYDHEAGPSARRRMRRREQAILAGLNVGVSQ